MIQYFPSLFRTRVYDCDMWAFNQKLSGNHSPRGLLPNMWYVKTSMFHLNIIITILFKKYWICQIIYVQLKGGIIYNDKTTNWEWYALIGTFCIHWVYYLNWMLTVYSIKLNTRSLLLTTECLKLTIIVIINSCMHSVFYLKLNVHCVLYRTEHCGRIYIHCSGLSIDCAQCATYN